MKFVLFLYTVSVGNDQGITYPIWESITHVPSHEKPKKTKQGFQSSISYFIICQFFGFPRKEVTTWAGLPIHSSDLSLKLWFSIQPIFKDYPEHSGPFFFPFKLTVQFIYSCVFLTHLWFGTHSFHCCMLHFDYPFPVLFTLQFQLPAIFKEFT